MLPIQSEVEVADPGTVDKSRKIVSFEESNNYKKKIHFENFLPSELSFRIPNIASLHLANTVHILEISDKIINYKIFYCTCGKYFM